MSTNNYYAASTTPGIGGWRDSWADETEAIKRAKWFVRCWIENGLENPKAAVYYRDGSIVWNFDRENCND